MPFQFAPVLQRRPRQLRALKALTADVDLTGDLRPLTVTWTEPREQLQRTDTVETAKVCFAFAGVAVSLAFARSIRPLPCCGRGGAGDGRAVPVSSALTWSGVRSGRCEISSAAAPETTAAACEVPLPRKSRSPMRAAGYVGVQVGPRPHAGRPRGRRGRRGRGCGCRHRRSRTSETTSSAVVAVPLALSLPTAIRYGS